MRVFLSMLLCLLIAGLQGQEFESGRYHTGEGGLMLEGYDPVSYFLEEEPLRVKAELKEVYDGVTFYFATEQNRNQFKRSSEKYLPAYGGFCTFGMGMVLHR